MMFIELAEGESIRLGQEITVTYVRADGDRVRIGIAAPRAVRILRAELIPAPRFGEGVFEEEK